MPAFAFSFSALPPIRRVTAVLSTAVPAAVALMACEQAGHVGGGAG
ncbi:hypothetical protein ACFC1T_20135 [Kitasatospora sp. NPDC056076]